MASESVRTLISKVGSLFSIPIRFSVRLLAIRKMTANDALLFIDANKYLDLYRTDKGKKLLAPLSEQLDYVFVTQRVVDEVQRNKIQVAADYLAAKFKELKLLTFNVPDHLTGAGKDHGANILQEMSDVSKRLNKVNSDVDKLAVGILEQVSNSKDEVSIALSRIFNRAIPHTQEELQRARERREFGNPPGKASSPIGDQLTWEQILSHFRGKRRLWIISRDGDYGTIFDGRGFVNRYLYNELQAISPAAEAFLFTDTVEGINHFVSTTGVKADSRLTPKELEEIEEEEQSLAPLTLPLQSSHDTLRMIEQMTKPSEEVRRLIEQITKSSEETRRMKEIHRMIEQMTKPNEEVRRMIEQMTKPNEEVRRMIEQMTKPNEEVRRMIEQMTKPNEEARRMIEQMTKPNEEVRRMIEQMTKPNEEVRRMIEQMTKPNEEARRTIEQMTKPSQEVP